MVIAWEPNQAPAEEEYGEELQEEYGEELQEESFADEDRPLFEDYASDNAGDPPEVEGLRDVIVITEKMCRGVHTPTNSNVSRICGRLCIGVGCCQRKVPVPHAQLRKSPLTRAEAGEYLAVPGVRAGAPPDGLAGSRLTPEESAKRKSDRSARIFQDAAEVALQSPEASKSYEWNRFLPVEEEIIFEPAETATPTTTPTPEGPSLLTNGPTAAAPGDAGRHRPSETPSADAKMEQLLETVKAVMESTANAIDQKMESTVKAIDQKMESQMENQTQDIDRKMEAQRDTQILAMRDFQQLVAGAIAKVTQEARTKSTKSKAPKTSKRRKFYAVRKGHHPGVYRTWAEAKKQMDGYPGGYHEAFSSEAGAYKSLEAGADTDSEAEESVEEESGSDYENRARPTAPYRAQTARVTEQMPDAEARVPATELFTPVTTDVSKGNPKGLFGKDIMVETTVLKRLCPKGVSVEMQKSLAAATLDATSLEGTYCVDDALDPGKEGEIAELTAAIRGGGEPGTRPVDSLWQRASRNPLKGIKDAEELGVLIENYTSMKEAAIDNMGYEFRNILGVEMWNESDVDAYLISGMLPAIARWTADYFLELLLKFSIILSTQGWAMAAVDIQFYNKELSKLRLTTRRRLPFLYRTYMFLREARHESWSPRKLLDARTIHLNAGVIELRSFIPSLGAPGACSFCGTTFLHKGQFDKCCFRQLPLTVQAQSAAGKAAVKISNGMKKPLAIHEAIVEAQNP